METQRCPSKNSDQTRDGHGVGTKNRFLPVSTHGWEGNANPVSTLIMRSNYALGVGVGGPELLKVPWGLLSQRTVEEIIAEHLFQLWTVMAPSSRAIGGSLDALASLRGRQTEGLAENRDLSCNSKSQKGTKICPCGLSVGVHRWATGKEERTEGSEKSDYGCTGEKKM